MNKGLMALAGAVFILLKMVDVGQAATLTLPVLDDESVVLPCGGCDYNINNSSFRGGLFSGVDAGISNSPAYFYLKFQLPTYVAQTQVTSAVLTGYYNDDYDEENDGSHGIYLVPGYDVVPGIYDGWSESTLTWDNQPFNYQYFRDYKRIANFNAAQAKVGTFVSWDITLAVNSEYQGDGVLSLLFRPDNDVLERTNRNWEYFAEKEFDSTKAFRLEVTIAAVPESTSALGSLVAAPGVGLLLKRKPRKPT